jgi:hypothetical protein
MPRFERLDLIDGNFILIEAPSVLKHAKIKALLGELHKELKGLDVSSDVDLQIYPIFSNFYQQIGDLLTPKVNCDMLLSESRHSFFVCTDPITIANGEQILGLSRLEQLMGYGYKEGEESTGNYDDGPSSGDTLLDAIADSLLIFKKNAPFMFKHFSLEDVSKIALQASLRMQQAQDKGGDEGEKIPEINSAIAEPTKAQIHSEDRKALEGLNIALPPV